MRIDLRNTYDPAAIDQTASTKASVKTNMKPAESSGQDRVSADVSTNVRLSGFVAKASSAPEMRQDRVDQLRHAIGSGTYSVSDEQLANAMLSDVMKQ